MSEQKSNDVRQTCLNLITNTLVCQLTTIDSAGYPQTTAMYNLRCAQKYSSLVDLFKGQENDFMIYLSTGMQSPKMVRMKANPKVSVYFCAPDQLLGVMLGGEIEVITDQQLKNRIWQKDWTMYYPSGPEGPEYGIIKLVPKVVRGWSKSGPLEVKI